MVKKIDSIEEVKKDVIQSKNIESTEKVVEILLPEKRQVVVDKIDKFLLENDMGLEEAMLGFTDTFNSFFVNSLKNLGTDEEKKESSERVNKIRGEIAKILNNETSSYLAEDMLAMCSIISEGIILALTIEADK